MADLDNIQTKISSLIDKKNGLQEDIDRYSKQIDGINEKIYKLREDMRRIDKDIAKWRIEFQKETANKQKQIQQEEPEENSVFEEEAGAAPVGGVSVGDAATTTASLDAASSGDSDGASWKFYDKVKGLNKRLKKKKKKKKTKSKKKNENNIWADLDKLIDGGL